MIAVAARLHGFGDPADVLRVDEIELPAPGPGELQLAMLAAPINPADLNIIAGAYGKLPAPPAVIGNEGAGRVTACGPGVDGAAVGDLVATTTPGCWCSHRNIPAASVVRVPPATDPLQAAMLCVNPATAHAMLHDFVRLEPGDWIAQNAANSGVGRCVIALARRLGLRTFNVVRRPELVAELMALGADYIVTEDHDSAAVHPFADHPPRLALNAVGGTSALKLAELLAPGGIHVTYGAMARQPVKIPNGMLIYKNLSFRGFWLRHWIEETPVTERSRTLSFLAELMTAGTLEVPIAATFPLGEIHTALAAAATSSRPGKILLTFP